VWAGSIDCYGPARACEIFNGTEEKPAALKHMVRGIWIGDGIERDPMVPLVQATRNKVASSAAAMPNVGAGKLPDHLTGHVQQITLQGRAW